MCWRWNVHCGAENYLNIIQDQQSLCIWHPVIGFCVPNNSKARMHIRISALLFFAAPAAIAAI
jgi:hypothetical protein